VHGEFRQILRFWFDRGVAGFRIDVAHGLYKDALLRDNPPAVGNGPLGGRFGQSPVYNENRPEVHEVYRDWRSIADSYNPPRLLLGETWVRDIARMAAFYGHDDELQLAFNFPLVFARFEAAELSGIVAATLDALPVHGTPVWTASNHDVGRFASRWCDGDQAKIKLALMVLATLPGTLVLYYGDEIGMADVAVPPELARDKLGGNSRPPCRGRARTPMQWGESPAAGFICPVCAAGSRPGTQRLATSPRSGRIRNRCSRFAGSCSECAVRTRGLRIAALRTAGLRTAGLRTAGTSGWPLRTASGATR